MLTNQDFIDTIVIPKWTHRALTRSKVNIIDKLKYSAVRNALSIQDLIDWELVQRHICIDKREISTLSVNDIFSSLTDEEQLELKTSVGVMGAGPITPELSTRLSAPRSNSSELPYTIMAGIKTIYVIVDDGFTHYLRESDNIQAFLETYLQTYLMLAPKGEMTDSHLFGSFIRSL